MIKSFFSSAILYTFTNLLTKGIGIIMLPIYTRYLTPEEFGTVDYLTAIGSFIGVIISLESYQALYRFLPSYKSTQEKNQLFTATIVINTISFSLFFFTVVCFSRDIALLLFNSEKHGNLINLVAFLFFINSFINLINGRYVALQQRKKSIKFTLVNAFVTALFIVGFFFYSNFNLYGVFLGQIIGAVTAILMSLPSLNNVLQFDNVKKSIKEVLSYTTPIIPSSIAVIAFAFIDRIIIKEFLSLFDLGIYSVALRISSAVVLLTYATRSALTPLIYKNHESEETKQNIVKIFKYFMLITYVLIILLKISSGYIVSLIASREYYDAYSYVPILSFSAIIAAMYIFLPGLNIVKKTGLISVINTLGLVINIILNYILINYYGLMGVAISTLISGIIVLYLHYYFSQKHYYLPIRLGILNAFISSCILIIIL